MSNKQSSSDQQTTSGVEQHTIPTLSSCLHLFSLEPPFCYVRWKGTEYEVERFHLHMELDEILAAMLKRMAVACDYEDREGEDNPYVLLERPQSVISLVGESGRLVQTQETTFEIFPIFTLERFRRYLRNISRQEDVRFTADPQAHMNLFCSYVRDCFDQSIVLAPSGAAYMLDKPEANTLRPLPYWAQLFQRLLSAISYDNLAQETLNWQDTALNMLEIVELLVSQYGELHTLVLV